MAAAAEAATAAALTAGSPPLLEGLAAGPTDSEGRRCLAGVGGASRLSRYFMIATRTRACRLWELGLYV